MYNSIVVALMICSFKDDLKDLALDFVDFLDFTLVFGSEGWILSTEICNVFSLFVSKNLVLEIES